jgi:hypothetical protein
MQIGVENRDYHYLSRFEIAGGKRISRHLPGSARPSTSTGQVKFTEEEMQMRHSEKSCGALCNTFDAKSGGHSVVHVAS